MKLKLCNRCQRKIILSNFNKDKTKKDGFYTLCKNCRLQYRLNNYKKIRKQSANYRRTYPRPKIKLKIICSICNLQFIGNNKTKYCSKKCQIKASKINKNQWVRKYRNNTKKLCPKCKKTLIYLKSRTCLSCFLKSKKRSKLISLSKKGKLRKPFNLKWRLKLSKASKGRKHSEQTKIKMRKAQLGKKGSGYIDGRTSFRKLIRKNFNYYKWRNIIFQRDNYKCKICGKKEQLEVHHIQSLSIIINNFLNLYPYLLPNKDKYLLCNLLLNYKPMWDIDNGIVLCKKCHSKTSNYRKRKGKYDTPKNIKIV